MFIFIASLLISGMTFAQDMSRTEKYENSFKEMPDGSSRYIGKCTTHEDYKNQFFTVSAVVQKYVEPGDLSQAQLKAMLKKFDPALISEVLKAFSMNEVGQSTLDIFENDIDDMTVELISHKLAPRLNLIRFSVGVGGGNGGYAIYNIVHTGAKVQYELMSHTFDSDLNYCDKKVWLNR
jgi:hypothetical protein